MKIGNKKGFTLIEVLSVVVILGIVSSVAVTSYSKYIKKVKENYYEKQEELVTQASRDYFNDNRGKLPQATGEETCVTLKTLIDNRYIDEVVDYNKKACDSKISKACAVKLSNEKYLYYSNLSCGTSYTTPVYASPQITMNPAQGTSQTMPNNTKKTVTMTINYKADETNAKAELASYRYVIYRTDKNDMVYYDTGWKEIKDGAIEKSLNIVLDSTGKYYIKGWAYNAKGKSAQNTSGDVTLKFPLNCNNDITFDSNVSGVTFEPSSTRWTNDSIQTKVTKSGGAEYFDIEVKNISQNTSDYIKNIFTRTKSNTIYVEGRYQYIVTAHDDEGNTCTKTSGPYQIDKTPPSCNVTSNTTGWTKESVRLTATCRDYGPNGSGCKQTTTQSVYSDEMDAVKTFTNIADKAGNIAKCNSVSVKIDKTPPVLNVSIKRCTNTSSSDQCKASETGSTVKAQTTKANPNITVNNNDLTYWKLYGASITYNVSDAASGYDKIEWEYNKTRSFTSLANLSTGGKSTHTPNSAKLTLTGPGQRQGKITAYDKVGNTSSALIKVNISTEYTLTYNSEGGTSCTPKVVTQAGAVIKWGTLCAPIKTGYDFAGWNKSEDGSGSTITETTTATGDLTVYAKWTAHKYYIDFDMDNGPARPRITTQYDRVENIARPGKTVKLNFSAGSGIAIDYSNATIASTGQKVDYGFSGWTADSNLNTSTAKRGTTNNPATAWSDASTKVNLNPFYLKNLTATKDAIVKLTANWSSPHITLPKVTRTGYTCKWTSGSYTWASGAEYVPASTNGTTERTFTAACTANVYTVTLDKQGGTGGTDTIYEKYNTGWYSNSSASTSISSITSPTKTGNTFGGYYTSTGGSGTQVINASGNIVSGKTTTFTSNGTLYAKWTPISYTIAYSLDSGSHGTTHPTSANYGSEVTISNPSKSITAKFDPGSSGATISSTSDIKKSYTFAGWTASNLTTSTAKYGTSSANSSWSNGSTKVTGTKFKNLRSSTGTVTLTANWTPPSITLPKVERTGFTCKWVSGTGTSRLEKASQGTYTPATTAGATSRTFTASCTPKTLTITYNKNDGTSSPATRTETFTAGNSNSINVQQFTRSGYTLLGWSKSSSATTASYHNGGTVTDKFIGDNSPKLTLYAVWQQNDPTAEKTTVWNDRYCTMHNGTATAARGSTTKTCSQSVNSGTNCFAGPYNTNNHNDQTYANMVVKSITFTLDGDDLKVKMKIQIKTGYWGTYLSGVDRYMCLKKGNRTFTNTSCTSNTITITPTWGTSSTSSSKTHSFTKTFTISDYRTKTGSYSFKMWGTYNNSCMDVSNVNNLNMIFSFQTDYIFKISY